MILVRAGHPPRLATRALIASVLTVALVLASVFILVSIYLSSAFQWALQRTS